MNQGIKTILYPVKDIAKAKALYNQLLGIEPLVDEPYYVGYKIEGQDIGLVPNGDQQGMTGPVGYYHVDDIHSSLQRLLAAGAQVQQEPRDVGQGRLVATVEDTEGNTIGILSDPAK
jgi:predicted enzyme related to lactoylglutathione lyase